MTHEWLFFRIALFALMLGGLLLAALVAKLLARRRQRRALLRPAPEALAGRVIAVLG